MVFVHGLGGDAAATWRYGVEDSTSWPHRLGGEFPEVGVWSLGYPAAPTKWTRFLGWFCERWRDAGYSMALPDRAAQVLDLIVQRGLGRRPLLFICHSLGGLLVKQLLRKADDATEPQKRQVATNTRAVLFLATPHAGAELASLANAFRTVFGATVSIEDLSAHDAHLRDLFEWYRSHAVSLGIETVTYFETRGIKGVLPIVNPTSAHPGVGRDPVGLDEDHLSIAKPRHSDREQVCNAARELLRDHVLAPRPASSPPPQSPPLMLPPPVQVVVQLDHASLAGPSAQRVPCELPPAAEQHFGRETELQLLTGRLRAAKNAAVVGPAGLGKTALAAEALRAVVGETPATLAASKFPDGVVYLDLYTFRGQAEPAWNRMANALAGPAFMDRSPARDRATEACRARRLLVVVEGGEEADGQDGRASIRELFSVLSPENRWLLLTRLSSQTAPAESVELKEALQAGDAAKLLDSLTQGRVTGAVRERVLELLEGHPLALTWAGNLLAREDDEPERLVGDWQAGQLPRLSDPTLAEHTLEWLFNRSVRGLSDAARQVLEGAGLLARAPFPLAAVQAALGDSDLGSEKAAREAIQQLVRRGLLRRSGEVDHWQFTHVLGYRFARKDSGSDPALRDRLAHWLRGHLATALAPRVSNEAALSLVGPLEHAAALLRADDNQRLRPLANDVLYAVTDRLVDLGRLDLVKLALNSIAGWLARLPTEKAQQPDWLRERSVLLNREGDVLLHQGDLAGSLAAYREALAVGQRLAAIDPSNAGWQRDLSVSHNSVGDVLRAKGDLARSLAAYRKALAIAQGLAAADPSNAGWQRGLGLSHDRVGDVLLDQGDLAGSLAAYRKALAVARRLAAIDPSNAGWQRDLSVSHNKVGDVLQAHGDLAGSLAAYQESLAVRQRLAAADPSNAGWQRDLSVSHNKVGDVLGAHGDLAGSLAAYREALTVRQRLVAADPSNAGWQRDLSVSHEKVGDVLRDQGDPAGSLVAYREALAIVRRLAAADPSNAGWQWDLSVSQERVGDVLIAQGDLAGSLAAYRESLAVRQRLAAADPSNAGWQRDLTVSQERMGDALMAQGDLAGSLASYRESLAVRQRLAAADPSNAGWQRDLSVSQERMGDALIAQGDLAGSLTAYRESLAVRQRLVGADPSNAVWQRDLSYTLTQMAELHEQQRNRPEALRCAEESLAIDERLAALDPTNATWQDDVEVSRALVARLRR